MAIKKIEKTIVVEKVRCAVVCPDCSKSYWMSMRGPETRKICPGCNHVTFVFTITALRGAIQVTAATVGRDQTPKEYNLGSEEIEVSYD